MSIFDRIRSAIFRRGETSAQGGSQSRSSGQAAGGAVNRATPNAGGSGATGGRQAGTASAGTPQPTTQQGRASTAATGGNIAGASAATAAATAPAQPVDVEAVLEDLARENKQPLNWRKSIVDLMKLLDMDSSVTERRKLAKELGYTGSSEDSAAMNVWLHKQVMRKLAENGGKVPAELRD